MRRLNTRTSLNFSSEHKAVDFTSLNSSNYDDFPVICNTTTSEACLNGTTYGNNQLSLLDYYYYYEEGDAGRDFFDVYYSTTRFAIETTMALLSMTLNVLVVSVIGRFKVTRQNTSVYNILFVNLAVTNALTSILLWFANNLLYFRIITIL